MDKIWGVRDFFEHLNYMRRLSIENYYVHRQTAALSISLHM